MLAVMSQADAVGEDEIVADRTGFSGCGIVAQQTTVRPALEQVEAPVLDVVTFGGVGEVDRAVGGDVEVVGHADGRVILHAEERPLGLVGQKFDRAGHGDAHEAHAGDAGDDAALRVHR